MPQRFLLLLAALSVFVAACGGQGASPSPTSRPAAASPPAGGSPSAPTPTAQLAKPAGSPSPSPGVAASPGASPSPATSPAAVASPAASPPAAAAAPAGTGGLRYRIIPEQSEARYSVQEKFAERPLPSEAVGATKDVSGEIELQQPGILRGRVLNMRVDLRTLASDSARRDNYIRQNTLQTDQFPFAEFDSTEVAGPTSYAEGEEASFQLPGTMRIRDQERPMTWDVRARLAGGTLAGSATATIKLTDFGMQPPRLAILTVEDDMRWEVDLTAEPVP